MPVAVGGTVSIAPASADPVYDQKFLDYRGAKGVPFENRTAIIRVAKQFCLDMGRQGGSTWKFGYHLMKDQGPTESEDQTFIQAAVPTYCPNAWDSAQVDRWLPFSCQRVRCLLLFRYRCCAPDPRSRK